MSETVTAAQRVALARSPRRPTTEAFIEALFTDFFELRGDRCYGEDGSILGGLALFRGRPVTVLAQRKGRSLEENLARNFGMASPEGYRKALRLMEEAQRFGRPVITFIDTPGAYPGIGAEERGQGEAIARCIAAMSALTVPALAVITGEGGSGGALALGVADAVIPEPEGGMDGGPGDVQVYQALGEALDRELERFSKMSGAALARHRYQKYRRMGTREKRRGSR